ncbi:MAG: TlpA disulfide reductase family protein [Planctomycetota bacterium]
MRSSAPSLALIALALSLGCASPEPAPAKAADPVQVGTLHALNGVSYDVDQALARGETVALVFWQTWCESCEKEAPLVAQAAKEHTGKIRFFGVVPGKDETVKESEVLAVADTWGYATFPQVRDRDLSLTQKLGVKGTPTIVVLGKGSEVLFNGHRPPQDWSRLEGVTFDPDTAGGCEGGVCPLPTE